MICIRSRSTDGIGDENSHDGNANCDNNDNGDNNGDGDGNGDDDYNGDDNGVDGHDGDYASNQQPVAKV